MPWQKHKAVKRKFMFPHTPKKMVLRFVNIKDQHQIDLMEASLRRLLFLTDYNPI